MLLAVSSPDVVLLFAGGGLVLYVASRAAVDALTSTRDPDSGRMALGQWMPIAWSALLATAAGHPEIGIGLALATSVAVLALVLGVLTILSPSPDAPPATARVWPFVLPAALLPLLAGFSASLNYVHAVMMAMLGLAVLGVWNSMSCEPGVPASPRRPARCLQLVIATALGGIGAWLGYQAILAADARTHVASAGLIAAAVLAPLLALPMLGAGAIAAHNGRQGAVCSSLVAIVLLNLCALLPAVVLVDYARQIILAWRAGAHELAPLLEQLHPVPFPLAAWRIDCVLIVVLGLLLVPVSLGRWTLGRSEGLALAFGYVAYLIASAAIAIRL